MKHIRYILRFLSAHIISAIVAATCALVLVICFDDGLPKDDFIYLLKMWAVIAVVITLFVMPFSVIFYGLPEWRRMNMPIWVYALLGAGFAFAIVTLLSADKNEGLLSPEVLRLYGYFIPSGLLAGLTFGTIRRRSMDRE